jgi:hypothetical protein
LSYLLIYRHIKVSNDVSNYSSSLLGEDLVKFNSYTDEVANLLQTYSGSFYKKDHETYYDIVYKFEDSNNVNAFYNALESANASSTILEYKEFKKNNPNGIMTSIQVILKNTESNTSTIEKTIET